MAVNSKYCLYCEHHRQMNPTHPGFLWCHYWTDESDITMEIKPAADPAVIPYHEGWRVTVGYTCSCHKFTRTQESLDQMQTSCWISWNAETEGFEVWVPPAQLLITIPEYKQAVKYLLGYFGYLEGDGGK